MRQTNCLRQSLLEIGFKTYKQILVVSLAFLFLLGGCFPIRNNSLKDTNYLSSNNPVNVEKSISREKKFIAT
jgi:hypothetical protein